MCGGQRRRRLLLGRQLRYGELGDRHARTRRSTVPVAVNTSGALAGKTLTQITVGW